MTVILFGILILLILIPIHIDYRIEKEIIKHINIGDKYYRKIIDLADYSEHIFKVEITKIDIKHNMIHFKFEDGSISYNTIDEFLNQNNYKRLK